MTSKPLRAGRGGDPLAKAQGGATIMSFVEIPGDSRAVEWPTAALAVLIYGLWLALTFWHESLPIWALPLFGGWTVAWHMSLQHEIIHGHPTRMRWLNMLIGAWPLSLWLPFDVYRRTHLQHHNDNRLTDPLDDPESYYFNARQWADIGRLGRFLVRAQATLLGRMTIGPAWSMSRFWWSETKLVLAGDRRRLRFIGRYVLELALVLVWVLGICGIPFWLYFLGFAYVGTALALVRSFAEHRAERDVERRTAIVERSWILGPLFLFNNLHVAHHLRASMPWYKLPRWYRANREALIARNGGLVYASYFDVAWRYFLHPHDEPLHPVVPDRRA
jgi:fatty acid desaturase